MLTEKHRKLHTYNPEVKRTVSVDWYGLLYQNVLSLDTDDIFSFCFFFTFICILRIFPYLEAGVHSVSPEPVKISDGDRFALNSDSV